MPNTTAQDVRDYWLRPPGSTGDPVADTPTEWRRVLAECEAKRRIIDYRDQCERDRDEAPREARDLFSARLLAFDATLRALALTYADHPDYDEAWRP